MYGSCPKAVSVWRYTSTPLYTSRCAQEHILTITIYDSYKTYIVVIYCLVLQNILRGLTSVCTGWDEGQSRQLKQRSRLWCDSGRSEGNKSQTRRNLRYHWASLTRHQKNRIIWSSTQCSTKLVSAFALWFTSQCCLELKTCSGQRYD